MVLEGLEVAAASEQFHTVTGGTINDCCAIFDPLKRTQLADQGSGTASAPSRNAWDAVW